MVNMHLCKKNHKNRVHQKKKTFVLSNYQKKHLVPVSEKNGMTLKHEILHKGTYYLSPDHDTAEILILFL